MYDKMFIKTLYKMYIYFIIIVSYSISTILTLFRSLSFLLSISLIF